MSTTANDILMGAAVPYIKFTQGVAVSGKIVKISEPYQERDYDPSGNNQGDLKFYKSGAPIMSFWIDLATTMRDPSVENDDGTRRVFMDGKRIKDAVRAAIRTAGANGLNVGATLTITCTHYDEDGDIRSGKNWEVRYVPGAAANDVLMGDQSAQQPAEQSPPPAQAAPVAPAAPQLTPEQIAALIAAQQQQAAPTPPPPPAPPAAPAAPQLTPEVLAAMQAAGVDISKIGA